MGDLYTAYPQLFNPVLPVLALFISFCAMVVSLYVGRAFTRDFPGRTHISALSKDVARVDGELGDLEERFTRFQKRKNMQEARQVKTDRETSVAEAQRILDEQITQ